MGRKQDGSLVSKNSGTNEVNILEHGLNTSENLSEYPLTYAIGHIYYNKNSFGYIDNNRYNSWNTFVLQNSISLDNCLLNDDDTTNKILLIQNNSNNKPYRIGAKNLYTFKGIVVRHGGILLIEDSKDVTIKTEFILIESGGLFQAGSSYKTKFRYKNKLEIRLINNVNYRYMGVIASQYSKSVYFPGFNTDKARDYTGTPAMANDDFGVKVVAVGFNGNYQLIGTVGPTVDYTGTWNSTTYKNKNVISKIDKNKLLTNINPDNVESTNIQVAYPNTWCRLKEGTYLKGDRKIVIDNYNPTNFKNWKAGYQILITNNSTEFNNIKDWVGMTPIWLDLKNQINKTANTTANKKFIKNWKTKDVDKENGVEVATIDSISTNGTITLKNSLQFNHICKKETFNNKNNETIVIDTNLHISLLTRNIKITTEFSTEPDYNSCNSNTIGTNMVNDSVYKFNNEAGKFKGPMNGIKCNIDSNKSDHNREVYNLCYHNKSHTNKDFCGNKVPPAVTKGHWIFGTEDIKGCNSIFGGQQMFKYGSSVKLDGVEISKMGTPANFGTIGRYPIHFHMAGHIKAFKEYLPTTSKIGIAREYKHQSEKLNDNVYARDGDINNCSISCSLTRFMSIHGTNNVNIRNNVGFLCYGSGFFAEDGTERFLNFEHNIAVSVLTASKHIYWNPIPLFPSVASDLATASCFWFKNNQVRCLRNVMCNSPAPIIGIWMVPQGISQLRGPSTLCLGDQDLNLPGLASANNALGESSSNSGLNQEKENNRDGSFKNYTTRTPCWAPDYFKNSIHIENKTLCPTYSDINCNNPYLLMAENIIYCMLGGLSEFPEALADGVGNYVGANGFMTTNGPFIGLDNTDDNHFEYKISTEKGNPQFLSANANNSCTDFLAQCTYFESHFGGYRDKQFSFQPLDDTDLKEYISTAAMPVLITQSKVTKTIPKIISNFLTWNLAPNMGALWGGAGWQKAASTWLINCCLLKTNGGSVGQATLANDKKKWGKAVTFSSDTSSLWFMVNGDAVHNFPNNPCIIHNLISNGGIGLPPTPTLITGNNTFISKEAKLYDTEYNISKSSNYANNDYYIDGTNVTMATFPDKFFLPYRKSDSNTMNWGTNKIRIYNLKENKKYVIDTRDGIIPHGTNITFSNTNKYPYVCNNEGSLFKISKSRMPHFKTRYNNFDNVVNTVSYNFISSYAQNLGNEFCSNLNKIITCNNPENKSPPLNTKFCCPKDNYNLKKSNGKYSCDIIKKSKSQTQTDVNPYIIPKQLSSAVNPNCNQCGKQLYCFNTRNGIGCSKTVPTHNDYWKRNLKTSNPVQLQSTLLQTRIPKNLKNCHECGNQLYCFKTSETKYGCDENPPTQNNYWKRNPKND